VAPGRHNGPGASVLAATEIYVGLTMDRADHAAFSPEQAAAELRKLAEKGAVEPRAATTKLEFPRCAMLVPATRGKNISEG
jgi:hypothetical protein